MTKNNKKQQEKEIKSEINNQQTLGLKQFQDRTLELAGGDKDKAEIASKMAELEIDFTFVKDLNTELARKYQELMDCFPTSSEVRVLLELLDDVNPCSDVHALIDGFGVCRTAERITKLNKFKSALVALEKQNHTAKPVSYEELTKK